MAKRQVFYSFHYKNDVRRAAQIRNIGTIEGNSTVSENEWEKIKGSDSSVEKWIDDNMKYRSCVIVLIGEETANRKWVKYEMKKAWNDGKGLLGIYIHNINDPVYGKSAKGKNPFEQFTFKDGKKLSDVVKVYDPVYYDAYNDIAKNLESLVEDAIKIRQEN